MSYFEDDSYDNDDPKLFGMYLGVVVKRDASLRRVKVVIHGLIEPESAWAYPIGAGAGGSANVGLNGVPREGATVHVWFAGGDPEHPYYAPGHWGEDEIPPEVKDKADATIWSSENFLILMDDTEGSKKLRILSRKNNEGYEDTDDMLDMIEIDAEDNSVTINGATALNLRSVGIISIDAANVQIKGRKVNPTEDPI